MYKRQIINLLTYLRAKDNGGSVTWAILTPCCGKNQCNCEYLHDEHVRDDVVTDQRGRSATLRDRWSTAVLLRLTSCPSVLLSRMVPLSSQPQGRSSPQQSWLHSPSIPFPPYRPPSLALSLPLFQFLLFLLLSPAARSGPIK